MLRVTCYMLREMLFDYEKQKALQKARGEEARNILREYSTGKNKGVAKKTIGDAKNLAKTMTPWGAFGLLAKANLISDWMYGLAFMAAIFKDIFDLVEVTGVLYIIVIILTFLASIFIAMMMLLGSFTEGHGRREQKIIRSWLVLLSGTTAELLFGVNLLPIETLTVLIIYGFVLSERKQAAKEHGLRSANAQESYA